MTFRALRPKPTDLDVMGIEELNEYIAELERSNASGLQL